VSFQDDGKHSWEILKELGEEAVFPFSKCLKFLKKLSFKNRFIEI